MISKNHSISDIRREYGKLTLTCDKALPDPASQFAVWFEDILQTDNYDPTAMVLATVDEHNCPDSRVVLLKGIENGNYIFYTNYSSIKAQQLLTNPNVALNFFWPVFVRQVRIRGVVAKINSETSDQYFASRPVLSQLSALASAQSHVIKDREQLEAKLQQLQQQYAHQPIPRPQNWGGYSVKPFEYEFWQGRDNRLHDRLRYRLQDDGKWLMERLAP